jgi:glycosyltransferase involved in cell wall biosynthesis
MNKRRPPAIPDEEIAPAPSPLLVHLVMLSTDRSIFDATSPFRVRLREQAALVDKITVIVLGTKRQAPDATRLDEENLTIIPTASMGKFFVLPDAYRIGKEVLACGESAPALITAQDPFEVGAIGYLLSRAARVPLHLQLHADPWSREWRAFPVTNRVRYMLAHFLLSRADGVRVVSRRAEKGVIRLGVPTDRITLAPIWTDVRAFRDAIPSFDLRRSYPRAEKIVLSMGRLVPEKNFRGLLRAFRSVLDRHPETTLLIVGSGPEREELDRLIRTFGFERQVKILPWARDVASYYKGADCYVQPSRYEGWGLAIVEAAAAGAPVVMADVGCAGEVIVNEESGLVVPVRDDALFAEAIVRVLSDRALAERLRSGAREILDRVATKAEFHRLLQHSWEHAFRVGQARVGRERA